MTRRRVEALILALSLLACTVGCFPELWPEPKGATAPWGYHQEVVVTPAIDSIRVGQSIDLRVKKLTDSGYPTWVFWTSNDTNVATVDSGLVHGTARVWAKGVGVAVISAGVAGGVGQASIIVVPKD